MIREDVVKTRRLNAVLKVLPVNRDSSLISTGLDCLSKLQEIVDKYPDTDAGKEAKEFIDQLK